MSLSIHRRTGHGRALLLSTVCIGEGREGRSGSKWDSSVRLRTCENSNE